MRKKDKVYSIIVVSGATTSSREFAVSGRFLRSAAVAVLALLAISGLAIFDYLNTVSDHHKLNQLKADVVEKDRLIADLGKKVETLDRSVQRMEIYTDRILVAAGLKSPLALREVGSGGPVEFRTDPILPANDPISVPASTDILGKATQLNTKSRELENTLKYVRSVIDKQKMRLASTPSIWPTRGYLTDGFGRRRHPITGKQDFHYGLDIATQLGNRVIAPANGLVLCAEKRSYYGNLIIVDHGYGFTTRYGHLASFNVREGQRVKRGDIIGYVGNTGMSSAPHLHYEIRVFGKPRNPLNYMID
jgi:murein DD-endopeptidase MepM/ murein hydrolase activator NlpD